ncbi:hypothetical protein CPC08DRAFT_731147 [Agrocybe pediades]|nr:hypothetical protein CPC08DRAFT_731147 [Agrocybe pediades]
MGVRDFIKYVGAYFTDRKQSRQRSSSVTGSPSHRTVPNTSKYVPVYDPEGTFLHYVQLDHHPKALKAKSPKVPSATIESNSSTTLAKNLDKTHKKSKPSVVEKTSSAPEDLISSWDGWPDGFLELDLTYIEHRQTKELETHWANISTGGDCRGQYHAEEWQRGKKLTRTCLGILSCDNTECRIVIRPHIRPAHLHHQLSQTCKCGHTLIHTQCGIRSYIYQWADGVHYSHCGFHSHRHPTHLLHITKDKYAEFKKLVTSYPNSGPLQLLTGVPTLTGPGQSAADIVKPFVNAHRIGKERLKIKKDANISSDGLIAAFAAFDKAYPAFVQRSVMGEITVISVQTLFMRSQLLKDYALDGQLNGMVSDAAHGWWKQRSIRAKASMLFESERAMDITIWESMPSTTNAEESLHWKLYSACGRDHEFLEGMYTLQGVTAYYERIYEAEQRTPIRYGESEPWKKTAAKIGRTKPSRAPDIAETKRKSKSDGPPPDTEMYSKGSERSLLATILDKLLERYEAESSTTPLTMPQLRLHRDLIRQSLKSQKIIKTISVFQSLFVWFTELTRVEESSGVFRFAMAFTKHSVEIHECTGCRDTGGRHIQLTQAPMSRRILQASKDDHTACNGSLDRYIENLFSIDQPSINVSSCWKTKDGVALCSGQRTDHRNLVISAPLLLTIELANERTSSQDESIPLLTWDIPSVPTPSGLMYDIIALALINSAGSHFIAHYSSSDGIKVYTYDGMENKGIPRQEKFAFPQTSLYGHDIELPKDYHV